eukprot:201765_1
MRKRICFQSSRMSGSEADDNNIMDRSKYISGAQEDGEFRMNIESPTNDRGALLGSHGSAGSFREGLCWQTKRERIYCVLLAIMTVLALVLLVALVRESSESGGGVFPPDANVCVTDDCVKLSGIMLQAMNKSADPCEDFYEYSCGSWPLYNHRPADKARWGAFSVLSEANQLTARDALVALDVDSRPDSDPVKMAAVAYQQCLEADQATDAVGIDVIREKYIEEPTALPSGNSFNKSELSSTLGALHRFGSGIMFSVGVGADDKNSSHNVLQIGQGGIGLPDRSYYLSNKTSDEKVREAYVSYIADIWTLAWPSDQSHATNIGREILAFETKLAQIHKKNADLRDPVKNYHKVQLTEVIDRWTWMNWHVYFGSLLPFEFDVPFILVETPDYFTQLEQILSDTPHTAIANYFRFHLLSSFVPHLSKKYRDVALLFKKALSGVAVDQARWKTCISRAAGVAGFAVGKLFVDKEFSPDSRTVAEDMISRIRSSFKVNLPSLEWMDEPTQVLAAEKADAVVQKIGFPDLIIDPKALAKYYAGLNVTKQAGYIENVVQVRIWSNEKDLKDLLKPVDRKEWGMLPQTVNAYYNPSNNEIVFPAGILQAPFFGGSSPKAINYGGIGAVMGHELTHGFDDQGAQYDKFGNLHKWWSDSVTKKFNERTAGVAAFYSKFSVDVNGEPMHVNGNLTLGENIADNGGIKAAYHAYKKWTSENAQNGEAIPVGLHDLTPEKLFFLGFAQVWCGTQTDEDKKIDILSDPHSPANIRVLGTLSNSEEFSKAWNCPAGSRMNPKTKYEVW